MPRIVRDIIILVAIFAVVWLVFSWWSGQWTSGEGLAEQTSQQYRIRGYMRKQVLNRYDSIDNPQVNAALDLISKRLLQNLEHPFDDTLSIFVIDDPRINAFVTLKGDMFVFTGLIQFVDSPEMLAAIIAHELGHLTRSHFEKRLSKEIGLSVVLAVLTGGDPGMAGQLSKSLTSLSYDRNQEREADDFAGDLMIRSGIDPNLLGSFFLKLQAENRGDILEGMSIFSTHPELKERIVNSTKTPVPDGFIPVMFNLNWDDLTASLKTGSPSGASAE